jgi:hypothetical protein
MTIRRASVVSGLMAFAGMSRKHLCVKETA